MQFKSPQVHLIGKVRSACGFSQQNTSLYVKVDIKLGESWKLINGKTIFETFESSVFKQQAVFEQPFDIHLVAEDVRGWPKMLVEVWKVDEEGRHAIMGYGVMGVPFAHGQYILDVPCWRPQGTWFDNFVGAHSELQHKNMIISSLSRFGLKTYATGTLKIQLKVLTKDFHLHGVCTG